MTHKNKCFQFYCSQSFNTYLNVGDDINGVHCTWGYGESHGMKAIMGIFLFVLVCLALSHFSATVNCCKKHYCPNQHYYIEFLEPYEEKKEKVIYEITKGIIENHGTGRQQISLHVADYNFNAGTTEGLLNPTRNDPCAQSQE